MTALGPAPGRRRPVTARLREHDVRVSVPEGLGLPWLAQPTRDGVSLAEYARMFPGKVQGWRRRAGAVMFQGFDVSLADFGGVATALAGEPQPYLERSSPRTELADRVYTATDYPADQRIPLHHENSYQHTFPSALVFGCVVAPEQGGATPLADGRRVLARIPPETVRGFAAHGIMYIRSFGNGLGLSWPEAFQTSSREAVTEYCRVRGIEVAWKPDGGLRTRQVRPAVAVHPATGERVWFNHALFFHPATLPAGVREALLQQVAEEDLPNQVYYGDGRPIPSEVVQCLAAAYEAQTAAVPWTEGDVLLVDNLLVAHGRQPFTGNRKVVVSMAAPTSWDEVDVRQTDAG